MVNHNFCILSDSFQLSKICNSIQFNQFVKSYTPAFRQFLKELRALILMNVTIFPVTIKVLVKIQTARFYARAWMGLKRMRAVLAVTLTNANKLLPVAGNIWHVKTQRALIPATAATPETGQALGFNARVSYFWGLGRSYCLYFTTVFFKLSLRDIFGSQ